MGFMASGKTSVGRALARRLGRAFVDTDAEIARAEGRGIPRIFAEDGEAAFRRMEERAISRASRGGGLVVAVGGGAVTRPRNVAAMRRSGRVVYLEASFAVLRARAERDGARKRPVWREAKRLLPRRRPVYRRVADLKVRAGLGSPERVAERIARRIGSEFA
ncbi:MAG: shikimate kinase [Elusimicrobiota bacterium]